MRTRINNEVSESLVPYFVTIGHPLFTDIDVSDGILCNKVMIGVDPQIQSPTQAAKLLRKDICDEKFKGHGAQDRPAALFWAIYDTPGSEEPFLFSRNTPDKFRRKEVLKKPTKGLRQAGKSLLGTELVKKGIATKAQTSKIGGLKATEIITDEWNPIPKEYQERDILAAITTPLLTAKELIDLGPKIEKDIKNATRKPRQIKSAAE